MLSELTGSAMPSRGTGWRAMSAGITSALFTVKQAGLSATRLEALVTRGWR